MPARINCPHCRSDLRLPEELYEGPAQCPCCKGAFSIRWYQRRLRRRPPASVLATEERQPCRFCGKPINRTALKCPFCQTWLQEK